MIIMTSREEIPKNLPFLNEIHTVSGSGFVSI